MAESLVVQIARQFREQLARNEDEALQQMSEEWIRMEEELRSKFILLAQEVKDLYDSGKPVPMQYIYTLQRYREMMEQIAKELPYYQQSVEDLIKEYQIRNYNLGIAAANAIIEASDPSSPVWTRVNKEAAEVLAGFAGNGTPLMQLLQTDYGELSAKIVSVLIKGVALGKGVTEIATEMAAMMGGDFDRALRIARTEINRAYRLANAEQYRRSGVVEKVIRLCYPPTACFACLMMDGEECPNGICDDHPNGKCTTIVQTTGGVVPEWEHGEEWFRHQSEEDQRRIMGAERFELWKNEGFSLKDMVFMKENPVWGGNPSMVPIKELLNGK